MKILLYFFALCALCCKISAEIPPHDGRHARAAFVSSLIKPGDIGAEIGVCMGVFAYHALLPQQPAKLYLIDPWQYGLQKDMEISITPENQKFRDSQYDYVYRVFADYKNVEIVRMKSEDAAVLFSDGYFDYVYIDGEHSYEAVMRDLTNYWPKVKVGGYLIGDDYGWTGIAPAVQEFLRAHPGEFYWLGDPYQGETGGQFAIQRLQ